MRALIRSALSCPDINRTRYARSSFRADGFVTDGVALATAMDVDLRFAKSVFRARHQAPRLAVFLVTGDGSLSPRKKFHVANFCEQVNGEHVPQVFRKDVSHEEINFVRGVHASGITAAGVNAE